MDVKIRKQLMEKYNRKITSDIIMNTQDGNQWNKPESKPKGQGSKPKLPGRADETDIRKGAQQEDQLESLKPLNEEDKAPNQVGSPPVKQINKGG